MKTTAVAILVVAAVSLSAAQSAPRPAASTVTGREAIVGLPCEGCEAVFQGIPSNFAAVARIAPLGEPGEPMILMGRVINASGAAVPGVIVYGYQTDDRGAYPAAPGLTGEAARHGRLRGWVITDAAGAYRFETIRPKPYPGRTTPAHVHVHVIEPGRVTYYIDDVVFDNDPLLTAAARRTLATGRGGNGVTTPARDARGVWQVRRDIVLGKGVPGYR
jgi:protocatechuate 3,4-dioxygenase beta subunit